MGYGPILLFLINEPKINLINPVKLLECLRVDAVVANKNTKSASDHNRFTNRWLEGEIWVTEVRDTISLILKKSEEMEEGKRAIDLNWKQSRD